MGRLIIPAHGGDFLFPRSPFNENMGRLIIPAHGGDFLFPRSPFNKNGCELIIPANGGDFLFPRSPFNENMDRLIIPEPSYNARAAEDVGHCRLGRCARRGTGYDTSIMRN